MSEEWIEDLAVTELPLRMSWDPVFFDTASAVAYGMVCDEWHGDRYGLASGVRLLADPDGVLVGFELRLSEWDPDLDDDATFRGPRFWVPALGLRAASPGEILLAAEGRWGKQPSIDAQLFQAAVEGKRRSLESAARRWQRVIEAGDLKGVFGLGYTLYDLGRFHEAHAHLRHYTELCPVNGWAWCWYGRVLEELGEREAAIAAYERAVELEEAGGMETDAAEQLDALR